MGASPYNFMKEASIQEKKVAMEDALEAAVFCSLRGSPGAAIKMLPPRTREVLSQTTSKDWDHPIPDWLRKK